MTSYIIRKISFILFSQRLQISYQAVLSNSVGERWKQENKSKIEQKCDKKKGGDRHVNFYRKFTEL